MKVTFLYVILITLIIGSFSQAELSGQITNNKPGTVEKWDIFEIELKGQRNGNPFKDVTLSATFILMENVFDIKGFYDGDGIYRIRFMPNKTGEWMYETKSNDPKMNGRKGSFICVAPTGNNRGPVRVDDQFHFKYAEGDFYNCFGTTTYNWINQPEELRELTLQTLREIPFNKNRMLIFPKSLFLNEFEEPDHYPFPLLKTGGGSWDGHWGGKIEWEFDWNRFDVTFFQKLDTCIKQLMDLGVEADIILFHPYDRWGFANMGRERDAFYLEYVIARIGAFRNVWWSLANEWDYVNSKTVEDWEFIGQTVKKNDPYDHLLSIHNGPTFFDYSIPYITHCSIQAHRFNISKWQKDYGKPVVVDEMGYEGDVYMDWGNLTWQELTHRFWEVVVKGGYPGHSEVFINPENQYWWNKGGIIEGESVPRIAFLKKITETGPKIGIDARNNPAISCGISGRKTDSWILCYFGRNQPGSVKILLGKGKTYNLYHIDTWNMTVDPATDMVKGTGEEIFVPLPGKPFHAVLLSEHKIEIFDHL